MRPFSWILALALSASFLFSGLPVYADATIKEDQVVVVAEDKTVEAGCLHSVQINNRPGREETCPPGSVIFANEMTYAEAKKQGIKDYIALTGDKEQDRKLTEQLISKVHKEKSKKPYAMLSCSSGSVTLTGSYSRRPSDPNSARIYYEVSYTRNGDCSVTNISDRSRTNAGTATWERTCTDGLNSNCATRNFGLGVNWSGWVGAVSSGVGRTYVNVSSKPCLFCGTPYGHQNFY